MTENIILSNDYQVPSKSEIAQQVESIVNKVVEGDINAIRAYGLLVALEKLAGDARKQIAEQAIAEAEKYSEKEIGVYGAKFQIKETGVKYDYTQDGEWQSYQDQLTEIRARQKGREVTLQALKQCAKSSTTTLQVTLGK
jgi:hypothetical protein